MTPLLSWSHTTALVTPPKKAQARVWLALEELLRALDAEMCVFTGIATNGVVEGTAREAKMREYHVVTLADYVAGYRQDLHEAPLKDLGNIGRVITSKEFLRGLRAQP